MTRSIFVCLTIAAAMGLSLPAQAHSVLTFPTPLTNDDNAKAGPCGCYFGAGPEDPAEDASPSACPADFPITTVETGSELIVEWKETVNHNGEFRIAFSPKAPDQTLKADVDANILMTIPDNNGTSGATLTQKITVPSEPCDLCVIQLRQFMINAAQPYYYSCAALKIVAPGSPSSGSGGSGGAGGSGMGGDPATTTTGAGPATTTAGPSTGAGYADPDPEVPSGCSATPTGKTNAAMLGLVGLALSLLALRKRRGRR